MDERRGIPGWLAGLLLGLVVLAAACATFTVYRIDSLSVPNKSGKLKNGLKVAIQPDPGQAMVLVQLRYGVGAANEPKDKKGLAHLVEHLAFRLGDELVAVEQPQAVLDKSVARKQAEAQVAVEPKKKDKRFRRVRYLTEENASTDFDETIYWKRVPPAHVQDVLNDLASQMSDFTEKITPEVFAAEKQVVRNERRSSYESQPLDRIWLDFSARFYPNYHPYGGEGRVIGTHATVESITLADVAAFLKEYYRPANAQLAVVGPVEPKATLDMVMKAFGEKPSLPPTKLVRPEWTPKLREETVVLPDAKQAMLLVAWPLGSRYSEEAVAMKVLDDAVGYFHWTLVTNRGWSYWAASWVQEGDLESTFVVLTLLKDPGNAGAAKNKILEIAGLMDSAARVNDLELARRRMVYEKLYGVESTGDRCGDMLEYFAAFDNPIAWSKEIEALENLDMGSVKKLGSEVLARDRAFVLLLTPGEAVKASPAAEATYSEDAAKRAGTSRAVEENRERLPPLYDFGQASADFVEWSSRGAERWGEARQLTLSNGIRVEVLQTGLVPVMSVGAVLVGGQRAEPREVHGVAEVLLSNMELAGNADRTYSYRMATRSQAEADDEFVKYAWKFPSVYADRGLELAAETLRSPQLNRTAVMNARDNMLKDYVTNGAKNAGVLARQAFWRGRGLAELGLTPNKQTLEAIGYGDVTGYADRILYPENVSLAVSSDLPVEQVAPLLEKAFGGWGRANKLPQDLSVAVATKPLAGPGLVMVAADTTQSELFVTLDGVGWADWQERALFEGVSGLIEEKADRIREAMGATYGVGVGNWSFKDYGVFYVTTKVERSATAAALRTALAVLDEVKKTPVRADELEFVRRQLIQDVVNRARLSFEDAQHLAWLSAHGRPKDHDRRLVEWATKLTLEELQAGVSKLLAKPALAVVAGQELTADELKALPQDLQKNVVRFKPADLL
jgi:zinc protease